MNLIEEHERERKLERRREQTRARNLAWVKSNPERHLENKRIWLKNNRERARETNRLWQKNNPEKTRESQRKQQNKPSARAMKYAANRRASERLTDGYLATLLNLRLSEVSASLLNLLRERLTIFRLGRQLKQAIAATKGKEMTQQKSETLIAGLGALAAVTTTGDLRRIVANAMLAHARGELSNSSLESLAKGLDSISASLHEEVKIAKLRNEMRLQGGRIAKPTDGDDDLGSLLIDSK